VTTGANRPAVVRVVQRAAHRHVGDVVDLGPLALTARVAELTPMIVTLKDLLANHAPVAVVPERAVFTFAHGSLSKHFGQGDRLGTSCRVDRGREKATPGHQSSLCDSARLIGRTAWHRPIGRAILSPAVFRGRSDMVLAAEWTFGDFFWSVLVVFAWVILIYFVIMVLIDIFRRHDINGGVKALWVIFVVLVPWFGVLIYLITQHEGWAQRNTREAARERDELRQVVGFSVADELDKLDRMKSEGRISDDEYQRLRSQVIG
jgi:Phospholipase_D-nuclease N-terminal